MTARALIFSLLWMWALGVAAQGELTIRITEGIKDKQPIAVVPFADPGRPAPVDVSQVLADDLRRSGLFRPIMDGLPGTPHEPRQINFPDWRRLGVANLVIGSVGAQGAGQYVVRFRLYNVFKRAAEIGAIPPAELAFPYYGTAAELRGFGHQIADAIYEQLTGVPGAFNTSIAYVTEAPGTDGKPRYSLWVADSDGYAKQSILNSREPILSPAWSPDGKRLAYVSYETGRSNIYLQNLASGKRQRVAAFPGINSAPAWSPDGRQLAMTLSKDGNPDIYIMTVDTGRFRRLTRNTGIDTEPAWSPDGQSLVFTSDRSGRPHIYRIPATGGRAQRLTFQGKYNARASFSPDGSKIVFVYGADSRFRIAVLTLADEALQVLTSSRFDESPSFAPNGSMILYATTDSSGGRLAAVSVDGRVRQDIAVQEGNVREPAWSPFKVPGQAN